MAHFGRRQFLKRSGLGLAAVGSAGLVLRAEAEPTEASGEVGEFQRILDLEPSPNVSAEFAPTEDNILGPYYRPGAPFRAKISPPQAAGMALLVRGRVWGHDTRQPLRGAVLDVWQANAHGRYDNDDPQQPPHERLFVNRARLVTDETGYYEFETIHPGAYRTGPNQWRPSHIHYLVRHEGYATLVTQLYFEGDPRNATDRFIKPSLIVELEPLRGEQGPYEHGVFDIVLARKTGDAAR